MKSLFIVLQAAPAGGNGAYMQFLMLGLIVVVFYFFMIRPQMKRQKEMKNFRESLKEGDKILTTGGIYGKIAKIEEHAIIIEVEDKMRLKVDKAAVLRDASDIEQSK